MPTPVPDNHAHNPYNPNTLMDLNMLEASIVCQIRQLVHLDPAQPDESIVSTVVGVARDARLNGIPFCVPAVLKVLYPDWEWGRLLITGEGSDAQYL